MTTGVRGTVLALVAGLALATAAACSSDGSVDAAPSGTPVAVFAVASSLDALAGKTFFDHPWPSDLRLAEDGTARFTGWPNPGAVPLLDAFVRATGGLLRGFSPAAAIYFRFGADLEPATLPTDPSATGGTESGVQLVDVDPASPERGRRRLVEVHWQRDAGETSHYAPRTLAVMPVLGQPLRPRTRYAAIVTTRVRATAGRALVRPAELDEALGLAPATERTRAARELFAPAVTELADAGVVASDIAHMTVFTTDDPTAETFAVADDVARSVPSPTATAWRAAESTPELDVYEGTYGPSPNYQAGTVPYRKPADGGGFVLEGGAPRLQGTFDLRFALAVPNAAACPPPAQGYPVVLYAHGTGGDFRSFVSDGTARALARACLASMGIDQIFHGTRPGAPPEGDPSRDSTIQFLFFNFDNALAARTNNRQAAIDLVQQARLFTGGGATVPAAVARTGQPIAFDASHVLFFGHSQGGLNGPLFLAASDLARGGVLSGAGSVLGIALLEKTKPVDIPAAVRLLVCGSDPECGAELSLFHPAITLAQSIVDATDPVHYGPFITRVTRPGFAPKSVYQTEGVNADGTGDTFAPPRGIEALALSIGLPRVAPGVRDVPEARWLGIADVTLAAGGVSGNLANGRATGVLAQFAPRPGRDGHFVVFDVPEARAQSTAFLRALADDPSGRVVP